MAKLCRPRLTRHLPRVSRAIVLAGVLLSCSSNETPGTGAAMDDAAATPADASPMEAGAPVDPSEASANDDGASASDDAVSSMDGAGQCTTVTPASCPTPIPSYAQDVVPVLNAKCNGCHTGATSTSPWALTAWVDVNAWALSLAHDLLTCTMPPADAGAPALTKAETDALLGWIVCGAPDN
jgi:hypothetical protein